MTRDKFRDTTNQCRLIAEIQQDLQQTEANVKAVTEVTQTSTPFIL